jgi:hypothetical protein
VGAGGTGSESSPQPAAATPAEAPVEAPVEASVEAAVETPAEAAPGETPAAETPVKTPVEGGEAQAPAPGSEASKTDGEAGAPEAVKEVDYKGFYERLIGKPIRANGKDLVLNTPEEVERLVQMGAGYGRKLQDMQPHLKSLRMLEKNNLLDEAELSFLIDLKQGNPEAIKKLIKESGIDPLDLSSEDNVVYQPKNHSVSDAEMAFEETLSQIQAEDGGTETLQVIHQTWDPQSKALLWDQPQVLTIIQQQRRLGIYDQIATEIERRKLLGEIPHNTPFLEAYRLAGDALKSSGAFAHLGNQTADPAAQAGQQPQSPPAVIATRTVPPKAPAANGDKARAASPTQATPKAAAPLVNPLEMADDEFLKHFANRL